MPRFADVVRDLIGRAAIAAWNTEQLFQITDAKVGHAPGFNFARRPEGLEGRHNVGKMVVASRQCNR